MWQWSVSTIEPFEFNYLLHWWGYCYKWIQHQRHTACIQYDNNTLLNRYIVRREGIDEIHVEIMNWFHFKQRKRVDSEQCNATKALHTSHSPNNVNLFYKHWYWKYFIRFGSFLFFCRVLHFFFLFCAIVSDCTFHEQFGELLPFLVRSRLDTKSPAFQKCPDLLPLIFYLSKFHAIFVIIL